MELIFIEKVFYFLMFRVSHRQMQFAVETWHLNYEENQN